MIDLKHEIKRELSRIDPPDLWDRIRAEAADTGDTPVLDLTAARHRRRPRRWLAVAAVTILLALVGALALIEDDQTVDTTPVDEVPTTTTTAPLPSGPLRTGGVVQSMRYEDAGMTGSWDDPLDTSEPWADLERVDYTHDNTGSWHFDLAASAPFEDRPGEVFAYGLVLDTNADGAADYEVGVDNGAPQHGELRAWVTDLATGEKREQVGPPYGVPVEFGHPTEDGGVPGTVLTFLGGTAPRGLDLNTVRFYAWTSMTRDGELVARDYAPDTGWTTADTP